MKQQSIFTLLESFLEYMEIERNASRLTIRNYRHYLKRFAQWYAQTHPKADIKSVDLSVIKNYRLYLSQFTDEKNLTLSRVTQSYHVIALRSFLKWLVKNDYDVLSPEKIDLPKGESKSLQFLNREQYERFVSLPDISELPGLRDRAILEVLFSTGLRVSELVKLNRDRIDFERMEFGVIGKGGKARVVFLSDRAAQWLKKYFEMRDEKWKPAFIRYAKDKHPKDPHGEDMRLTTRSVQRIVEKYRKSARLPVEITPHGLRHTFATDLLFQGAGLREVQEMLGHKNIATTQIYTHVTNPQLRQVHRKFHSGNKEKK